MTETSQNAGHILIIAIESGRWGPARLPRVLKSAGFGVSVLCPRGNVLAATDHVEARYELCRSRSSVRMAESIAAAIASCRPTLIVPADEQVVALLQSLVRQGPAKGSLDADALALIVRSLGDPDRFDALLLKSETLALAHRLGVRAPESRTVHSAAEALQAASAIGYPVYLKRSFGWAGNGVVLCRDAGAVCTAMSGPPDWIVRIKATVRRWIHRDWYPATTPVDVQQAISGISAMYSGVARQGRLLAGFAGTRCQRTGPTGPSTVVEIGPQADMARATEMMVRAMGASGFIAFDFILEQETGDAYLLECNPRPNQVCHLGSWIGVDLAVALAASQTDRKPVEATSQALVTLFPQEWLAKADATAAAGSKADIPSDDPGLFEFMMQTIAARWAPSQTLRPGRLAIVHSQIARMLRSAFARLRPSSLRAAADYLTN